MCVFQLRFSSNNTRKLIQSGRFHDYLYSILVRLVGGYHFFARFVEKRVFVFFFTISESLLEMNHFLIVCNSSFTLRKAVFISLFEWNKFAFSKYNRVKKILSELKVVDVEKKRDRS